MRKGILLFCCLLAGVLADASAEKQAHTAASPETRGTEAKPLVVKELPAENPVVVKVLPIEKSTDQIAQDKMDREERRASDKETSNTNHTLVLVGLLQLFVFTLQFVAFARQSKSLNETVLAAREQSNDMKRYIGEASRSASATEAMAAAMRANVAEVTDAFAMQKVVFRNQLRAYVSVSFRGCIDQIPEKEFRFEIQSDIQNNGSTPAFEPNTASALGIFPVPLPDNINLDLPMVLSEAAANLAPHKSFYIRTALPALLAESELEEIKRGVGKRIYIYGTTRYKDIFGESHLTNFCWSIGWAFNGNPIATNASRHNDAT